MNRNKTIIIALMLMLCYPLQHFAQLDVSAADPDNSIPELPLRISHDSILPLRNLLDPALQAILQNEINKKPKWKKLVEQKRMAVGIVDLSDPENVRFARVNGNVMMYAASLPKIAILLAVMDAIEKGELEETPVIQEKMQKMIAVSSNTASTDLIDILGFDKIESVLKDPQYELYDEDYGGGLWVGKRYSKTGERHPDPLRGISHGATVSQICRFYYMLAFGKLVNYERSKQMLEYMDHPGINHKFVNVLSTLAPGAQLYRKSGTWKSFHSDSILVWGPERRYILVALLEDEDGERILRNLVMTVDKFMSNQ